MKNRLAAWMLACLVVMGTATPRILAQDPAEIDAAVRKGVAYLKRSQLHFMDIPISNDHEKAQYDMGTRALAGLALIESGVPKGDPKLRTIATAVRSMAPRLDRTYSISLAIMFLDRYGSPGDRAMIQTLTLRLAAGQTRDGGWSYPCPILSARAEKQWLNFLRRNRHEVDFDKAANQGGYDQGISSQGPDNSNAQFAVLALWIGRRQGIPVEYPLLKAEWRFRKTQNGGGWGYSPLRGGASASMTCSGLLGLAVAWGAAKERETLMRASRSGTSRGGTSGKTPRGPKGITDRTIADLRNDPAVQNALRFLIERMNEGPKNIPHLLYFLWSLERMCVVYELDKDNWVDWYGWGCAVLLPMQRQDGSWSYENGTAVDTSFALLFLRRANLLKDLGKETGFRSGRRGRPIRTSKREGEGSSTASRPSAPTLPPAQDAERLKKLVITESGERLETFLARLRDNKGSAYTYALAEAISQMTGRNQELARQALAQRLKRMKATTLAKYLKKPDKELRRAAAAAAASKSLRDMPILVPVLIPLLKDFDPAIAENAYEALKQITTEDYGRSPERWQQWWDSVKDTG